ncbi:MAG: metallopeptidase family protein [Acidobacteriota bacterium]
MRISEDQFEAMVGEALDSLPDEFAALLDNVAVVVEEEPDPEILAEFEMDPDHPEDGELFGLYQGISLAERDSFYSALPDRIAIYRGPILRFCRSRREVLKEVRDTVIHELGHHFGLDEDDMPY